MGVESTRIAPSPGGCGRCAEKDAAAGGAGRSGVRRSAARLFESVPAIQPGLVARSFVDLALDPLAAARFFLPTPGAALAWRELLDKGQVFLLVSQNAALLGLPTDARWPLQPFVRRAYELDDFAALWAVEGLGHEYAASVWADGGEPPRGLLTDSCVDDLPAKSLLMLHAGMGLELAQRVLDPLGDRPDDAALAAAADRFVELCRDNSRPGYTGAAYESCGLVARTFHPRLVRRLGAALRERHGTVADYFWHGMGRALYFLPVNFLPCGQATWRAYRLAIEETPDERAQSNAIAGLAWAVVLVTQRQPAITADLLRRHGVALASRPGFSEGVLSSVVMRAETTPGAPFVGAYCAYRPADRELERRWRRMVGGPCEIGLDRVRPRLAAAGRLDEVFRFIPLAELEAGT